MHDITHFHIQLVYDFKFQVEGTRVQVSCVSYLFNGHRIRRDQNICADSKATFHDLLNLHLQSYDFTTHWTQRFNVSQCSNTMNRQLSVTTDGSYVVILQVYNLICMLNDCTKIVKQANNNN